MANNDTHAVNTPAGRIGYREADSASAPAALFLQGVNR